MANLAVEFAGLKLKNPVLTASGTCGFGQELGQYFDIAALGGIMLKGTSAEPWPGNAVPRIAETPAGMLNAVGLQNPGMEYVAEHYLPELLNKDLTVILNVAGHSVPEYAQVVARMANEAAIDAFEINISCPNVAAGGLAYGTDPQMAAQVIETVRKLTNKPIIAKLSPNVTSIQTIAQAVEAAGADAISLINTILGMAIDIETRRPILKNNVGGISGPAVRPVAVRMVWQAAQSVKIPVIGMGGIMSAEDALEFMMVGASAVAIGAGTFTDPFLPLKVIEGLENWLDSHGIKDLKEIIGSVKTY